MSEVNFTLDDVVAKVREVAAERPDYVYESPDKKGDGSNGVCYYRHGENREEPGCIVGVALDRLGYVVPELYEGTNGASLLEVLLGLNVYEAGAGWVRKVQASQDDGKSWGEAVEAADATYPSQANG